MYHPYIRQKIFEARAQELERIAAQGRTAEARPAAPAPHRRRWSLFRLAARRVAHR
jgi:hypothetical protein